MSIKVKFSPDLYSYTNNQQSVEVNGKTVAECLDHVAEKIPGLKRVIYSGEASFVLSVYIKGDDSEPWDLFRPVNDGDELTIALGGG